MKSFIIITGVFIMTISLTAEHKSSIAQERSGNTTTSIATFAGGCFWCMVAPFEKLPGVKKIVSGYIGGNRENPTYEVVSIGKSGHVEAVQIYFDSTKITYTNLLDIFWKNINPTDPGGQFADRGKQYTTAIFYHNKEQKTAAVASRDALEKSGIFEEAIVTAILPAKTFYPAEMYHQDYHLKNPLRYKQYREGSGRTPFLHRIWGDNNHSSNSNKTEGNHTVHYDGLSPHSKNNTSDHPSVPAPQVTGRGAKKLPLDSTTDAFKRPPDNIIKRKLTPQQYAVAVCSTTEPPFDNTYWDNKRDGIYVDIITGEPLFSSNDKFDSGTGWPSFIRPIKNEAITERPDTSHGMNRIEVRSKKGDTHLGHLFTDGPAPSGMRYCINSASLRFIPKDDLEKNGYREYLYLFK